MVGQIAAPAHHLHCGHFVSGIRKDYTSRVNRVRGAISYHHLHVAMLRPLKLHWIDPDEICGAPELELRPPRPPLPLYPPWPPRAPRQPPVPPPPPGQAPGGRRRRGRRRGLSALEPSDGSSRELKAAVADAAAGGAHLAPPGAAASGAANTGGGPKQPAAPPLAEAPAGNPWFCPAEVPGGVNAARVKDDGVWDVTGDYWAR